MDDRRSEAFCCFAIVFLKMNKVYEGILSEGGCVRILYSFHTHKVNALSASSVIV